MAGRYRDLNSPWELPLAGQMLALALVFVLWIPSIIVNYHVTSMLSDSSLKPTKTNWERGASLLLLLVSLLPLVRLLKFESWQRAKQKRKERRRLTSNFGTQEIRFSAQIQSEDLLLAEDFNLDVSHKESKL